MKRPPSAEHSGAEPLAAAARVRMKAVNDGLSDGPAPPGLAVAVIVADLHPAAFIGGITEFVLAMPADLRDGWYRTFTRTVFLVGRPASLSARYPHLHTTVGADLAWYGPARQHTLRPLSRVLRAFHGPAPVDVPSSPLTVTVPQTPSGHIVDAAIAIGGVSTAEYLVHTHHLIAEATLRGLVRTGDTIRVDHRQDLDVEDFRDVLDPARADMVQTRITRSGTDPDHLRLYGVLTSNRDRRPSNAGRTSAGGAPPAPAQSGPAGGGAT